MIPNLERYKKDLESLIARGTKLEVVMQVECYKQELSDKNKEFIDSLPTFKKAYQSWYSEPKVMVKQLLPDRLSDLVRFYEKPNSRKGRTNENYKVEDYLQGLTLTAR